MRLLNTCHCLAADQIRGSARVGTIMFIGAVDFAPGRWIGIKLEESTGKNDGCVNGKRYFTCQPNHGSFVQPHKVEIVGSTTYEEL